MTTQTKPIEAYSLPTPNGQKVHIMLEELGVPWRSTSAGRSGDPALR